ncbi:uncharacterized protein LOC125589275 [Brassica napus]|uniref:uncharacterized protein LOC125589275 n=1 Tax=Brassica napus TaxID=3708 RepID=UPI0020798CBA|nr:uncharacterized protein LOC125589275 [Brassica napus]
MLLMRTAPAPSLFRPPPDPPPCGHFHGSLQLQPSSSVSNPIKQVSSPMAPVVTASPPSPLHLPHSPLRLRLPPDLPPPWSCATVPFESLSPPEPPDPSDASLSLVIHRLFDTPFTFSQASFNIPNLASDVCSVIFSRLVVWRRHCSSLTCVGSLTLPFIMIEGKLVDTLIPVNRVMEEFHYPMDSFVEQFLFPIFLSMWSELDGQASLVLQGSSSWLMLFSAFVAVFVTFEVTRYAIIQEDYEIFLFFMVSCNVVYRQSIFCLIYVWFVQPLVALMYSPCREKLF